MKFIKVLFIGALLLLSSFGVHKYYMSLTQITYSEKQNALQIVVRIFIDDLEDEINDLSNTSIELATDREPKNIDSIYYSYLKKNLLLKVNSKFKNFEYIGKEYNSEEAIFYLEITKIDTLTSISTRNTILNHLFPKQENILKTKVYGKHKSFILTPRDTRALINF